MSFNPGMAKFPPEGIPDLLRNPDLLGVLYIFPGTSNDFLTFNLQLSPLKVEQRKMLHNYFETKFIYDLIRVGTAKVDPVKIFVFRTPTKSRGISQANKFTILWE